MEIYREERKEAAIQEAVSSIRSLEIDDLLRYPSFPWDRKQLSLTLAQRKEELDVLASQGKILLKGEWRDYSFRDWIDEYVTDSDTFLSVRKGSIQDWSSYTDKEGTFLSSLAEIGDLLKDPLRSLSREGLSQNRGLTVDAIKKFDNPALFPNVRGEWNYTAVSSNINGLVDALMGRPQDLPRGFLWSRTGLSMNREMTIELYDFVDNDFLIDVITYDHDDFDLPDYDKDNWDWGCLVKVLPIKDIVKNLPMILKQKEVDDLSFMSRTREEVEEIYRKLQQCRKENRRCKRLCDLSDALSRRLSIGTFLREVSTGAILRHRRNSASFISLLKEFIIDKDRKIDEVLYFFSGEERWNLCLSRSVNPSPTSPFDDLSILFIHTETRAV